MTGFATAVGTGMIAEVVLGGSLVVAVVAGIEGTVVVAAEEDTLGERCMQAVEADNGADSSRVVVAAVCMVVAALGPNRGTLHRRAHWYEPPSGGGSHVHRSTLARP